MRTILNKYPIFSSNTPHLLKIGLVANLLEWYDYSVFGYLSITMGQLFWKDADPMILLTNTWLVFAFSYVARPIGSLFWGYVGDRYGYSYSLRNSLLTMAVPTILIGMLPTYHHIGFVATTALILLRFIQGFAAGGELPVSAYYIFENAPPRFRSILCSSVSVGVGLGLLSGSMVTALLHYFFTPQEILQGAWRIPYLLSIPLTAWILTIRRSISNTSHVSQASSATPNASGPKSLIQAGFFSLVLLVGFMEVSCYILLMWLPSYLTAFLHIAPHIAQTGNLIILATLQCLLLVMGYVASRIGYKRVLLLHTTLIILLTYPLFKSLQTPSIYMLITIHIIFAWLYSGLAAVMMEALGNAYPKGVRCSGMSVTHTVGATLFGGTAPSICIWLTRKTGFLLFPACYMIGMGLIAIPIILRLKPLNEEKNLFVTRDNAI